MAKKSAVLNLNRSLHLPSRNFFKKIVYGKKIDWKC